MVRQPWMVPRSIQHCLLPIDEDVADSRVHPPLTVECTKMAEKGGSQIAVARAEFDDRQGPGAATACWAREALSRLDTCSK